MPRSRRCAITVATVKVVLVEDDPDTREIVTMYLNRAGFEVLSAANGTDGLRLIAESAPHVVILDIMLPGLNGLEACRRIREQSQLPIIMLTALTQPDDRIAGLGSGADDYIVKPFDPRELVLRIEALLRRTSPDLVGAEPKYYSCGDITLDLRTHEVTAQGVPVRLTPTEMRLLAVLMGAPSRVFTRDQLVEGALQEDSEAEARTVDNHLSNLRRKLGAENGARSHIHTVRGAGYMFSHE